MSKTSICPPQRTLFAAAAIVTIAIAGVVGFLPEKLLAATTDDTAIRPFHIHVPQAKLDDLHRRIAATRWPDKETVNDETQGITLAEIQALVHYWDKSYDWRKGEAKLNALPEFVTKIDGVDIQFIHV